jgi:hypothetical protein
MLENENLNEPQKTQLNIGAVRRSFSCLKCKEEVIYLDEDLDIMERAENNDGVFCSSECEYSFYNGGDGCDY